MTEKCISLSMVGLNHSLRKADVNNKLCCIFVKTAVMEAIRHIVTPMTNHFEITIPDDMVHEKLEVIILPLTAEPVKTTIPYKSLMGSVSENEAQKMLQYLEASRNEWE